jgi:class 3 adenylate cyclase
MKLTVQHQTTRAMATTALVVDLRNFTPNLGAAEVDDKGTNVFCSFLAEFHAMCVESCLMSVPKSDRDDPPFVVWSTGDGVLVCFTAPEQHVKHAYLSALVMQNILRRVCVQYAKERGVQTCAPIGFGIGLESGEVWGVQAESNGSGPKVRTYVGPCINIAARAQEVSKTLYRARTILGPEANRALVQSLTGRDYAALVTATKRRVDDAAYLALEEEMNDLNRRLCVGFIHLHALRGVAEPLALFRVSESTTRLGNPRFEALLEQLTDGSAHLTEVRALLSALT